MGSYILRRILLMIPTLIGVLTITFFISNMVPGGPVDQIQAMLDGKGDKGASTEVSANTGSLTGLNGKKRRVDPKQEMRLKRVYGLNHTRFERYLRTLLWFSPDSFISSREIDDRTAEKFISKKKNCIVARVDDTYYSYVGFYANGIDPKTKKEVFSEVVYDKQKNCFRSVVDNTLLFDLESGKAKSGDKFLIPIPNRKKTTSFKSTIKRNDDPLQQSDLEMMINAGFSGKIKDAKIATVDGMDTVEFNDSGRKIIASKNGGKKFMVTEIWTEVYRDESLAKRLANWDNWHGFFLLKFGDSIMYSNKNVLQLIKERLPVSMRLGIITFFLTYTICIILGIAKAVRNGSAFDTWTSVLVLFGNSIPGFVLAVLLIACFGPVESAWINLFPLGGLHSVGDVYEQMGFFAKLWDNIHHLFAPIICLCIGSFAVMTMLTKNSVLDEFNKLYATAARARGLSEKKVLFKHILRNSMIPLVTVFPGSFLMMFFTGSMLIEKIFNLNGLGLMGYTAVMGRDFPVIMSNLFIFTIIGLSIRLITDICYVIVDPRISFDKSQA